MKRIFVTLLVVALGPACGGSDSKQGTSTGLPTGPSTGTQTGTVTKTDYVGATMSGINACGTISATLSRRVPLTLGQVPPDLEVGPAWVSHSSEDYTNYFRGVIKVTNKGITAHCFVKASSISYLGEADQPVGSNSLTYVYGRVQVLTSGVSTQSCLDPGENGYFNIIEKLNYFDVASIHVESFDYDNGGKAPLANLQCTGYTVTGKSLSIPIENVGTGSADDLSLVVYALDAAGEFQHWTFGSFSNRGLWSPGEKRTGTATFGFDGPCPKALALPYFKAVESSPPTLADKQFRSNTQPILSNAQGVLDTDALTAALLHQRDQTEEATQVLLRR
jgi:hypothetical protein